MDPATLGAIGSVIVAVLNPRLIKYLLIFWGIVAVFTLGLFEKGIWVLAILLFILFLVMKRKK